MMKTAIHSFAGVIVACGIVFGQQPSNPSEPSIKGTVTDSSGAVIPGAKVSLFMNADSAPVAVTTTDREGEFQFFLRRVQEFTLVAEANCFQRMVVKGISSKYDETTRLPPIIVQVSQECPGVEPEEGPPPVTPIPSELPKSLDLPNQPVKTTPCELVKEPARLNGKVVSVRGRVLIGFENFRLDAGQCAGGRFGDLWLEYGRGPKRQPVTWCCGDLVPRDPLSVVQDQDFKTFHQRLTAQSGRRYVYQITATLTGRFDAVDTVTCPDGEHQCPKQSGFGHLAMSPFRLVIESVSDVVAKPMAR
jgi:hypothetical protein